MVLGATVAATAEAADAGAVADSSPEIERLIRLADEQVEVAFVNKEEGHRLVVQNDAPWDFRPVFGAGPNHSHYDTQGWYLVKTGNSDEGYFGIRNSKRTSMGEDVCLEPRSGADPLRDEAAIVMVCEGAVAKSAAWLFRFDERAGGYAISPAGNANLVLGEAESEGGRGEVRLRPARGSGESARWYVDEP